jgi:type III pantothenate kinase
VGNTSTSFGIFQGKKLVKRAYSSTRDQSKKLKSLLGRSHPFIQAVVVSSVVPRLLPKLKAQLRHSLQVELFVVKENIQVPIRNRYRNPKEVGSDRLVNALAGFRAFGGPLLVIDFGTALTFDWVNQRGDYMGGLIMPGMEIWLDALFERTALLPRIQIPLKMKKGPLPGRSTRESIQLGALCAYAAMVDGLISLFQKQMGKRCKVVACGGRARRALQFTKRVHLIDLDLTLKGLNMLYFERNQR